MLVSPHFNDISVIHYTILHLLEQVFYLAGQQDQSFIPSMDSSCGSLYISRPRNASSKISSFAAIGIVDLRSAR